MEMYGLAAGLASLALALAACGDAPRGATGAGEGRNRVTIEASEYRFGVPGTMAAGQTTIVLKNVGQEPHFLEMVKITGDQTIEQLLRLSDKESQKYIQEEGGIPPVNPGGSKTGTFTLSPGRYGIVCFIEAPDGTPHAFKGMVAEFQAR